MTWTELHRRSEIAAADAGFALAKGNEADARRLFAEAAEAETEGRHGDGHR